MTNTPNPIEIAEFRHQRFVINNSRSGRLWILLALVMLVPGMFTSLYMFSAVLLGEIPEPIVEFRASNTLLENLYAFGFVMMLTMAVALTIVVMLVSFSLASNSINREKVNKTWPLLLMTNISARKLVMGKWKASLRAMNGDFVMVGLLRLGVVAWLMTGFIIPNFLPGLTGSRTLTEFVLPAEPHEVLGVALIVLGFTFIDTLMNTAIGLFAVLVNISTSVTFPIFVAVRVLMVYFWLYWVINTVNIVFYDTGSYLAYGVGGLILYLGMVFGVLRLAQFAAVYGSNASPGERADGVNTAMT